MQPPKGWKSSEFWVSILTTMGALMASLHGSLPPQYAAWVALGSAAAYAIARGLAKQSVPPAMQQALIEQMAFTLANRFIDNKKIEVASALAPSEAVAPSEPVDDAPMPLSVPLTPQEIATVLQKASERKASAQNAARNSPTGSD